MSKETDAGHGAVAGRVERPVRPCAWTLQAELDARETTCRAHLWFIDPVNSAWAPLYDQAAVDAARMAGVRSVQEQTAVIVRAALELLESIEGETPFTAEALRTFKRVFGA